jgi:hypothetical protein
MAPSRDDGEREAGAIAREHAEQDALLDGAETPTTAALVEILARGGYTAQRHGDGRVTFFDRDGDVVGSWLTTLVEHVRRERREAQRT